MRIAPELPTSSAICASSRAAASCRKLPIVDPGKYSTRRRARRDGVGTSNGWVKSAHTGRTSSAGNSALSSAADAMRKLARDFHRRVGNRAMQRSQQEPRLDACAAAVLDEMNIGSQKVGHLRQMLVHDSQLGPRRVVLGQLADLLEQLGAARVVEERGGQRLGRIGQALHGRFEEALAVGREVLHVELGVGDDGMGSGALGHRSLASRMPENCQRSSG